MSSGVPIDKAQAVHAGGESALWKWISWNYFFVFTPSRFLTVAVPLIQNRVRQQAIFALQNLQGDLSEALPTIVELMKDKDLGINRNQMVWILQRCGVSR